LNEWLVHNEKPRIIVATKADKLSNNELRKAMTATEKIFDGAKVLPYSATTGRGREDVWSAILSAVENY